MGTIGPAAGVNRVKRGGSWNNNAQNARAANRNNNTPDNRNNNIGFRPASSDARPMPGDHGCPACACVQPFAPSPRRQFSSWWPKMSCPHGAPARPTPCGHCFARARLRGRGKSAPATGARTGRPLLSVDALPYHPADVTYALAKRVLCLLRSDVSVSSF